MDPNETLAEIRRAVTRIAEVGVKRDWQNAQSLADSVEALDEWLTRGGFLPDEWHHRGP